MVISWAAQRGVVALPKSVTPSRIETNGKLIVLSDEEMLELNELHKQEGKAVRLVKPNVSPKLVFCHEMTPAALRPLDRSSDVSRGLDADTRLCLSVPTFA